MLPNKQGKLVVLTGPSGVGKGTLLADLRILHPGLYVSISATTRPPRPGEVDGVHYYFLDVETFKSRIAAGELLEWAEYVGNYYGTPRTPVVSQLNTGRPVVLEIEVEGARQVKSNFPAAMLVFVAPPSEEELAIRLRNRGTEDPQAVERRLARARQELAAVGEFDYQVVNDDLDRAVHELERIVFGERYS